MEVLFMYKQQYPRVPQTCPPAFFIILLHEFQTVIDALPRIIECLQELDLEIINLQ